MTVYLCRSVNGGLYWVLYTQINVFLFKNVCPRTSDYILCYCVMFVMPFVSDCFWLASDCFWLTTFSSQPQFSCWLMEQDWRLKEAIVLWSNSDLCFPKRNSVYVRVFGKWEVDFFEGLLLRSNLLRVGPCSWLRSHIHHWPLCWKTQMANYTVTRCWTVHSVQKEKVLSKRRFKCWRIVGNQGCPSRRNRREPKFRPPEAAFWGDWF